MENKKMELLTTTTCVFFQVTSLLDICIPTNSVNESKSTRSHNNAFRLELFYTLNLLDCIVLEYTNLHLTASSNNGIPYKNYLHQYKNLEPSPHRSFLREEKVTLAFKSSFDDSL